MNPIGYMQRTRDLYRAQGFTRDYVWAHHVEIPFQPLNKPLGECTLTIVTTAVIDSHIAKPLRKAASYSHEDLPDQLNTSDLAWDKATTHTDDRQSYFPLEVLEDLAAEGKIGKLAPRFHFVPTEYSQGNTTDLDAPAILDNCREDGVDVALLIPL